MSSGGTVERAVEKNTDLGMMKIEPGTKLCFHPHTQLGNLPLQLLVNPASGSNVPPGFCMPYNSDWRGVLTMYVTA